MMQEVDYMSDALLGGLEGVADVRPGLLNREAKRKVKSEKKAQQLPKPKKRKVIEAEAREKGLSLPISSDNKGFLMLHKMGYQEGSSLGKSGDGKITPIPLVINDGKTGLGRTKFISERESERKALDARSLSDFRLRKQASLSQRRVASDLHRSKLACHQLDTEHGWTMPSVEWHWPEELLPKPQEEESERQSSSDEEKEPEEELEMEPAEQLEALTAYLREMYFYCIWCGTAYHDEDDMQLNCPGNTEDAHDT